MESLQHILKNCPITFEDFRKWLFEKLKRNSNVFKQFFKYPFSIQCFYFLEFLESRRVPLLDAMVYQYYHDQSLKFEALSYKTIVHEFAKLEKKIVPETKNYNVF